jgi:HSP20 family protein
MQITKKKLGKTDRDTPQTKKSSNTNQSIAPESTQEGQLALDIYQTATHLVILAPIAGVKLTDLHVAVTEDILSIKGARFLDFNIPPEDYLTQECFWGDFSRSIVLPAAVDSSKINASFKDGILKITIPKTESIKTKVVRIKSE